MNSYPRGSALVVGFAIVILLLAITMAFASRVSSNTLRSESDMAGERAYEMAQSENTLRIQAVWSDFRATASEQRVAWLGGGFDPEEFDIDAINTDLKKLKLK